MKQLSLLLLLMLLATVSLRADSPRTNESVKITEMAIVGEPRTNNLVELRVKFVSYVDARAFIKLTYPHHLAPIQKSEGEKEKREVIYLQAGKEYEKTYLLKVYSRGSSMLTASISLENEIEGFSRGDLDYLVIESENNEATVFDHRHPDKYGNRLISLRAQSIENIPEGKTYDVSINGKAQYRIDEDSLPLIGSRVELFFRRSTGGSVDWLRPGTSTNTPLTQHMHYDIIDVNGNFYFDFSSYENLLTYGYDQIILLVSRDNLATYLEPESGGFTFSDGTTTRNFFGTGEWFAGMINPVNPIIDFSNVSIIVNPMDGQILRDLYLSRDFVIQRYNGSVPFSFPPVLTKLFDLSQGDLVGRFEFTSNGTHYIVMDNHSSSISLTNTSHEFGHYVNYKMWNSSYSKMNGSPLDLLEGWAIFHSFAVKNFANRTYGDYFESSKDNTETAPFNMNPRFDGIAYAIKGFPSYAAFGCYLWNLYDGYTGGNFETNSSDIFTSYDIGDNDDISGYALRVFEKMRTLGTTNTANYHATFKNGLLVDEQNSVDAVWNYMTVTTNNPPRQKSPQVKSLNIIQGTSGLTFTWQSQRYPSSPSSFSNTESGYKIYKNVNNSWQLISTLSSSVNSITINNTPTQYKVTSYNSTGESANAPVFTFPLSGFIEGPSCVNKGQTGVFSAVVSGGTGTNSYQWTRNGAILGTGSSISLQVSYDFTLTLTVTSGTQTITTSTPVTVCAGGGGGCDEALSSGNSTNALPCLVKSKAKENFTPTKFELEQNYPNPFNPSTTIAFGIPEASNVTLMIYNMQGQEVRAVFGHFLGAGYYESIWDGKDDLGKQVASGIYIYRIQAGNFVQSKKMTFIK